MKWFFAGDINGHIGSINVGYDGTHGGFGYGSRNTDGSRILEFADGLNLVISNTLFTKQEAKLVTYVAGPGKSTVDYIMVQQEDKAKVRNVNWIGNQVWYCQSTKVKATLWSVDITEGSNSCNMI